MRLLKFLGATLAAVFVLLVAAALLLAWLFDPNDYKDHLADLIEQRTGRTLHIGQDLDLSFFPWLAVETGDLTLGNAPGFDTHPFATADRIEIRVKLLPLLQRQFEVGTVIVDGLAVNLARDGAGTGNWEDLLALGDAEAAPEPSASEGARIERLDIEGIRVRSGRVAWYDNSVEPTFLLSDINIASGAIALGAAVDLDFGLEARDVAAGHALRLDGRSTVQIDTDGHVAARGVNVDLVFSDSQHTRRVDGNLRLASLVRQADGGFTLGETAFTGRARALPAAPPELDLGFRFGSATVSADAEALTIADLTTEMDGIGIAWQIDIDGALPRAVVAGTATIDQAPLARVFTLLDTPLPSGVTAAALGHASVSTTFRYDLANENLWLTAIDAALLDARLRGEATVSGFNRVQGRLEIAQFTPGNALLALLQPQLPDGIDARAIGPVSLAATIDSDFDAGRNTVRNLTATLLGATIRGEIDMARSGQGQLIRGSISTSRFPPEGFAAAFAGYLPEALLPGELGMLAVDTRFSFDTAADTLQLDPLRLEAFGLNGSGRISGRSVSGDAVWTGQAEVATFSPRDLLNRFAQLAPDTSDPTALTRANATAGFEVTAERGRFDNIVLALDDSRITGSLTVDGFDDPAYLFSLAIDRVDADRYLPPRSDQVDDGEMTAGDIELEVDALHALKLSGSIEVGALALAGMQFQQVATRMEVGGGRARLTESRARLYGGEFQGSFGVDITGAMPAMTLAGRASGLAMRPLIEALTGDANLSGTGSFELNLSGRGAKIIDNVRSAGGNLGFALADGSIDGFNLGRGLCVAYNALQRAPGPPSDLPPETRFDLIQGSAEVREGVAHTRDLTGRSSFLEVAGSGRLVLAEQYLDYQLEARLSGPVGIRNCETMDALIGQSIPLRLRGPVTDAEIAPDYSQIIERQLRREVERRVTDRLQDLLRR